MRACISQHSMLPSDHESTDDNVHIDMIMMGLATVTLIIVRLSELKHDLYGLSNMHLPFLPFFIRIADFFRFFQIFGFCALLV